MRVFARPQALRIDPGRRTRDVPWFPYRRRPVELALRAMGWLEPAPSEANFILVRMAASDATTVREALRRLAAEGLVEWQPQRGARVEIEAIARRVGYPTGR